MEAVQTPSPRLLEMPVCLQIRYRHFDQIGLIEIAVTHLTFETGSEKYKALETSVFVSAGRFVVEKDKPVMVEYKVSKVIKA